ncbi:MAG: sulfate adenylyltransferase subunit CysN, partial [Planctomycetes bacterium]|nr:sulfate adenylyltransferase subunit CysN [Planctomycetota bacterium]
MDSNAGDKILIKDDIMAFLARHESKELLRFVTIGSVDDGKSTLIGRLLYDTENVFDDILDSIKTVDADGNEVLDLANITDG